MIGRVFREDIAQLAESFPWGGLSDKTILVTGATGVIGNALVHALVAANQRHGLGLRVVPHGRNVAKGQALAQLCGDFLCGDLRQPVPASLVCGKTDYIFHCAAVTASAEMAARPLDVAATMADGTRNVLELARQTSCDCFVYLSSQEVYGQLNKESATESDLGFLDLSAPRSCYPESKRFCEMLCAAYAAQYRLNTKIARPAIVSGAGIPRSDRRVLSQFAESVLQGRDIELHTQGRSRGNFCYTADAVRGLLTIAMRGQPGEAYNVANPAASATILELAETVARIGGGKSGVVVKIPEDVAAKGYPPGIVYSLNADKLQALGWSPRYGLEETIGRLLDDWRSISNG